MAEGQRLLGLDEAVRLQVRRRRLQEAQGRLIAVEHAGEQLQLAAAQAFVRLVADAAIGFVQQRLQGVERQRLAPSGL